MVSNLALALALFFGFTPASATPAPEAHVPTPQCATMGESFQCDSERAMTNPVLSAWDKDFQVFYMTTRIDGTEPVAVPGKVLVLRDAEYPNMYHVYRLHFAPSSNA